MAVTSSSSNERIVSTVVPMTPLNVYLQRVGSVSNKLRAETSGYEFLPFQLGGLIGQQQALVANVAVSVIDFKVSGDNK